MKELFEIADMKDIPKWKVYNLLHIFYIILVLSWSLSVTWVISKIFKDDNIKN